VLGLRAKPLRDRYHWVHWAQDPVEASTLGSTPISLNKQLRSLLLRVSFSAVAGKPADPNVSRPGLFQATRCTAASTGIR